MLINWDLAVFFIPFISLGVALISLILALIIHVRIKRIFRSATSSDIEKLLKLHSKTLEDFIRFKAESEIYTKALNERIKKKIINASTIRFNPFQGEGIGGNQSFSVSLADEEGNGVVITSMHTRERTNVFAKPIQNWKSEYELSEEEKQAIKNQQK
ncbi:MAG: DUF4446 family protein [Candidatus Paceibacterota bacterium]|jgi:hypothetical protein